MPVIRVDPGKPTVDAIVPPDPGKKGTPAVSVTPPQPGLVQRAELFLVLNVLRAQLALVKHILGQHQDEALAGVAADLASAIGRLEGHPAVQTPPET